ncbi:MAG: DUF4331 domain-containing protein [Candidatus Competibacterales bacterium]
MSRLTPFSPLQRHPARGCLLALALATGLALSPSHAANHREAPITALDHKADIADFFAFVSYDDPSKVTFILDVDPLLEPSNGPNYTPFDPNIIYAIHVDNDFDAQPDVSFEFRFQTEIRLPGVFTSAVGAGSGIPAPANSPAPVPPGSPIVPPAITALDGEGSEGLGVRQSYTVTLVRDGQTTTLNQGILYAVPSNVGPRTMPDYTALFQQGIYDLGDGVRSFAGTVDDPFWIDLGAAFDSLNFRTPAFETGVPGVLSDAQDANDTVNFAADDVAGFNVNALAIEVPITLVTQDGQLHPADDPLATIGAWGTTSRLAASSGFTSFGLSLLRNLSFNGPVSGAGVRHGMIAQGNVTVLITAEREPASQEGDPDPQVALRTIGGDLVASNDNCTDDAVIDRLGRPLATPLDACLLLDLPPNAYVVEASFASGASGNMLMSLLATDTDAADNPQAIQIQRMGNPLFNELIIGTGDKDAFSLSPPHLDEQFADYALDPLLARVLNAIDEDTVGEGILPIPEPPRTDLLPLVQYLPPIAAQGTPEGPVADLLRLNTAVPPTPVGEISRLGLLAGDAAGFPNGRRVSDDVTDIATRVVLGVLAGEPFNGFPHNRVGDGVNANDVPYLTTFPYVAPALSGVESRHVDPGEPGCTGVCP